MSIKKTNVYFGPDIKVTGIKKYLKQPAYKFHRVEKFPEDKSYSSDEFHIGLIDSGLLPFVSLKDDNPPHDLLSFICVGLDSTPLPSDLVFINLPQNSDDKTIADAIEKASQLLLFRFRSLNTKKLLEKSSRELFELNQIGIALSAERDLGRLLDLILEKSMELTNSDAGSIYLVEEYEKDKTHLRFKHTKNYSVKVPFKEFTLSIDEKSMGGYVAFTGKTVNIKDAYKISSKLPFKHNKSFDNEIGYRTKSMLGIPMNNKQGEIVGVLQLINRKTDPAIKLLELDDFEKHVIPYDKHQEDLISSLASQAAVAIENNLLTQSIENLFEGFVRAAVLAIEQRDPPTSGHSARVAAMTCALAKAVNETKEGPFANVEFTPGQIKEMRYAGLLHDFGKVGVREEVLIKAKKLYPYDLELILKRFEFIHKSIQADLLEGKTQYLIDISSQNYFDKFSEFDQKYNDDKEHLDDYLETIIQANEPTILPEGSSEKIHAISREKYLDLKGAEHSMLTSREVEYLSVRKGTLTAKERKEIESHVTNSFKFLINIPWTKECSRVPEIALAHHEKLDGGGYIGMAENEIPLQSKIMAVVDIYDALTAADRPYKKALPREKALQILNFAVKDRELDPELVRIFIDKKVYLEAGKAEPGKLN